MKRLFLVLISAFFLFSACSDFSEDSNTDNTANAASSAGSDEVLLKVDLDEDSASRTALPGVSLNKCDYISLMYINDGLDYNSGYTMVGNWQSVDELKKATLPFKVGTYYFTLTAVCSEVILEETKQYTISKGTNSLSFTPKLTSLSLDFRGIGNVNVELSFNTKDVAKVKAGLYTTDGQMVPGYNDEVSEVGSGGKATYKKEGVPSGSYIVIFKFYADSACEQLLGTYREYASIVNGLTSSSNPSLDSIGSLFTINYELDGGGFADGVNKPGSYTKKMGTITLPVYTKTTDTEGNVTSESISRDGYTFDGWYDNADFTGNPVTEIPSGSTGDKTFYAKWIQNVTIHYTTSEGSFLTTTHPSQTVVKGQTVNLIYANTLGIKNGNRKFQGWAKETGVTKADYEDGAQITVNENLTLYAVWTLSNINPNEGDSTDTDGDGLTDWQELNVYYTDPASKDTDGDGWTDSEESSLYNKYANTFNPLIADTPSIEVKITGIPSIKYNYSISETETKSESESFSQGYSGSSSSSSSKTNSLSVTGGWSTTTSVKGTFEKLGYPKSVEIGHEESSNYSKTTGDSYTYGKSESEGWSKSWSNGKSKSKSNGKNITDAELSVKVIFKNPSNIAYTVEDITLSLYRLANNSVYKKIFLKNFAIDDRKIFTLAPGAESGIFSLSAKLNLDDAEKLLKYSNGFIVDASGYRITLQKNGEYTNDFTETLTAVKAKTASIYIDFGKNSDRASRMYNASVKYKYNVNATEFTELYSPVSLKDVMTDILHLTEGVDYTLDSTTKGIESIYKIENTDSNKTGGWFISHKYYDEKENGKLSLKVYAPFATNNAELDLDPDISKIILNPGDEISIVYTVDTDGDGVPWHEERIYGTSDEDKDSDGDGLTDGEEIYGWWKNTLAPEKYGTEGNKVKVCTNPVLKDTDADDLWDYRANAPGYADPDPVIPQASSEANLVIHNFSFDGAAFKEFADGNKFETIRDNIYLQVKPVKSLATLKCIRTCRGDEKEWDVFDETTPISLGVGENTITVRCTAPDGTTVKDYTFTVTSSFPELTNFKAISPELEGGQVIFSWNTYVDGRTDEKDKKGGYYLRGCKASDFSESDSLLTYGEILEGTADVTGGLDKAVKFALKIDSSKLASGRYTLKGIAPNTDYCFYLFAYTGSDSATHFAATCLAKVHVKTAVGATGTLTFYAHWVEAITDHDEGCDPQYYWTFSDDEWGLSELNHNDFSKKLEEFDDDDDKYFGFNDNRMYKYGAGPSRFSNATKKIEKKYDRSKDHKFTVSWTVKDYDPGSYDDYIGCIQAIFEYSSANDTWTCTYGPFWAMLYSTVGKKRDEIKVSLIRSGQRTNGLYWKLENKEEGEVGLAWDWSWDYEELR